MNFISLLTSFLKHFCCLSRDSRHTVSALVPLYSMWFWPVWDESWQLWENLWLSGFRSNCETRPPKVNLDQRNLGHTHTPTHKPKWWRQNKKRKSLWHFGQTCFIVLLCFQMDNMSWWHASTLNTLFYIYMAWQCDITQTDIVQSNTDCYQDFIRPILHNETCTNRCCRML